MVHQIIAVNYGGKKNKNWDIVHNLDEVGLDIMAAFDNYVARAKAPNINGFCEYVKSKDAENIICMTKKRYNEIARECNEREIN